MRSRAERRLDEQRRDLIRGSVVCHGRLRVVRSVEKEIGPGEAAELVDQPKDGTWCIELADVRDPALVVAAIASSIGARGASTGAADALAHLLEEQDVLLVLDNCEHLVESVAAVTSTLLRGCPSVRVLATSREPLGLPGEVAWRIPPLTCPAVDGATVPVTAVSQFDSVRLFLDRAQHVRPTFTTDDANTPAIAAICSRLDGVPLAIELAATRCRSMTPAQVLEGLNDAFRLLTGSTRGVVPRQATLEASLTWSHDLLSEREQVLLRRLSVFVGGCTLASAEAVCSDDVLPPLDLLDLLDRLVAQSLVVLDDAPHPPRYRLLETVRQYAARRLDAADEATVLRERHLAHYLDMFTSLRPSFEAMQRGLDPATAWPLWWERDNIIAALDHAAVQQRWSDYALLANRADDMLFPGSPDAAIAILDRVPKDDSVDRALRAETAYSLAFHLFDRGDLRCVAELDRVLTLAADGVDPLLVAHARGTQATLMSAVDPVGAGPFLDALSAESQEFAHPLVQIWQAFAGLMLKGSIRGDVEAARGHLDDLEQLRAIMPNHGLVMVMDLWAALAMQHVGDLPRAAAFIDRAERWWSERTDPNRDHSSLLLSWPAQVVATRESIAAVRGFPSPEVCLDLYDLARRQGLDAGMIVLAAATGLLARGDVAAAFATYKEVEAIAGKLGSKIMLAVPAMFAARAGLALGEVDDARARLAVAEEIATNNELTCATGVAKGARAEIALVANEPDAWASTLEALDFAVRHTFRLEQVDMLEVLTALASAQEDHREVARLSGAVARVRDDLDYRLRMPAVAPLVDEAVDAARRALGDEGFDAAYEDGHRLDLEEVTAYALRSRGERSRPSTGWASLTPTERVVVEQVRLGLTNPQIAERLLMSRDTVKTHLSHIYTKLGVSNRTELTAEASRAT